MDQKDELAKLNGKNYADLKSDFAEFFCSLIIHHNANNKEIEISITEAAKLELHAFHGDYFDLFLEVERDLEYLKLSEKIIDAGFFISLDTFKKYLKNGGNPKKNKVSSGIAFT